jgi:hypothetical protein
MHRTSCFVIPSRTSQYFTRRGFGEPAARARQTSAAEKPASELRPLMHDHTGFLDECVFRLGSLPSGE